MAEATSLRERVVLMLKRLEDAGASKKLSDDTKKWLGNLVEAKTVKK